MNRQQQTPALVSAAAEAGVPGVKGSNSAPAVNIIVENHIGTKEQSEIVVRGFQNDRARDRLRKTFVNEINKLASLGYI